MSLSTISNVLGGWWVTNVVDFVFKTLSQSSHLWGPWVTNLVDKLCRQNLVSHHESNSFSKRNSSYWTVQVLTLLILVADDLANFGTTVGCVTSWNGRRVVILSNRLYYTEVDIIQSSPDECSF
jgi:hypothetical protein